MKHKNKKPKKLKDFHIEKGESLSFPLDVVPQYPEKLLILHNEAVYYICKLFDRLVIKRSIIEDGWA